METTRAAPVNVRCEMTDGRVIPVELVYVHTDDDGVAMWRCTTRLRGRVRAVLADELPPRTGFLIRGVA